MYVIINNLGTYSEAEEKLKKLNLQQYVLTTDSELDVGTARKTFSKR